MGLITDFRVNNGIQNIEDSIEQNGHNAHQNRQTQNHAVVAVERAVDKQLSDAGNTEHVFNHNGAGNDADECRA